MKIGNAPRQEVACRLLGDGLALRIGPFQGRIRTTFPFLVDVIQKMYADFPLAPLGEFSDFRLSLQSAGGISRMSRRSGRLILDGAEWARFPPDLAYAYLEWGLNWTIFRRAHHLLVVHGAALERNGAALVLPAQSGSGKSTLSAALCHRGWRLLSDELALITPDALAWPALKPVCLKEKSITVLQQFAPEACWGPAMFDRDEQMRIRHLRPPSASVDQRDLPASPDLVVFPRFFPGSETNLQPLSAAAGAMKLAQGAFNYLTLGKAGFDLLSSLAECCRFYSLVYSDLDSAVETLRALHTPAAALARA